METLINILAITMTIFTIVLAVMLILAIKALNSEKENSEILANESYNEGRKNALNEMRSEIYRIEDDRSKLFSLSEKELLVETMLALSTYRRRLDFIDEKMKSISNYKAYIESMNQLTIGLSGQFSSLKSIVAEVNGEVTKIKTEAMQMVACISKANESLCQADSIEIKADNVIDCLKRTVNTMEEIYSQTNDIAEKTNSFFDAYADSPVTTLNTIKNSVNNLTLSIGLIGNTAVSVEDTVNLISTRQNALYNGLSDIKEEAKTIRGEIESTRSIIKDSLDPYGFDNVVSYLKSIEDDIDLIKSEINSLDSINNEIDSIKSAVENSLGSYGYGSLSSQLDDVKSKLDDIERNLP